MKTTQILLSLSLHRRFRAALGVLTAAWLASAVAAPAALVVHIPYDNNNATNRGSSGAVHNGTLAGGAAFTSDAALGNGAVALDSAFSSYVQHVPAFPGNDGPISGTTDRTLSIWTKNSQIPADGQRTLISIGNGESGAPNGGKLDVDLDASNAPQGVGRIELGVAGGRTAPNYASPGVNSNTWSLVTVTWSATLGAGMNGARIYVNGQFVYAPGPATPAINTGNGGFNDFFVGKSVNSLASFPSVQQYFNGLVDDASVWSVSLSDAELLALYQAGAESALKYDAGNFASLKAVHDAASGSVTIGARTWVYATNLFNTAGLTNTAAGYVLVLNSTNGTGVANWNTEPPQFVTQPVSQTNVVGTSATFTSFALGQQPFGYQWYFNNAPLGGATAASFTRNPVTLAHAGSYFVVATNVHGARTSSVVTLTVVDNTPPFITVDPTNVTVIKGQPISLAVTADGSPTLAYQWRKNGTPVGGATSNPYNIASTAYGDAGNWDVVVTNNFGAATSAVAVVTILDVTAPVIANATNRTVAPAGPGGTVLNLAYITATDDKDGAIPVTLAPPSSSLFPPGVTVVKATATDSSANGTTNYFTVSVLATVPWQTNFLDTFTVSGPSDDINFEYNTPGRQFGVLSPIRWIEPIGQDQFGANDARTEVGSGSYPGTLFFSPVAPSPNLVWASPARDFVESPTYAIEFDVQPPGGDANNSWAGFSWGTPTPLRGPDISAVGPIAGMGLLFRTSDATNEITFWQGGTILHRGYPYYQGTGLAPLPTPPFKFRVEVHGSAFGDGSPALVRAFINGTPIRISQNTTNEFFWVKTNGFAGNYFTVSGFAQATGQRDSTFDNVAVYALPSIWASRPAITTIVGRSNQTFNVTVPPTLVTTSAVSVVIANANPSVATLVGEVGGQRTLTFNAGTTNVQTVTVVAHAAGDTMFTLSTTAGVPSGGEPVSVSVLGLPLHIANPSFEEPPIPALPGWGNIPGWGVSDPNYVGITPNAEIGGALANNSLSVDGSYVAMLRSLPSQFIYDQQIATTISNLTSGQIYELSLMANSREGGANASMDVVLNGTSGLNTQVAPVGNGVVLGYKPVSLVFTAAASTVSLAISNQSLLAAEALLLVDSLAVKPLDTVRWSTAPWTGDDDSGIWSTNTYTHAYNFGRATNITINGVTFTGLAGANPSVGGQLVTAGYPTTLQNSANNNLMGESFFLARDFIYNGPTPSLTLQGLVPGAQYRLTLFGGGWPDTTPGNRVTTWTDGVQSLSVNENTYGSGNGILLHHDFVATGTSHTISGRVVSPGTYHTFAVANQLVALPVLLNITRTSPTQVRIAWPAAVTGYTLQSSSNVASGYTNVGVSPSIEGSEQVVYQTISGNRYYRLIKP